MYTLLLLLPLFIHSSRDVAGSLFYFKEKAKFSNDNGHEVHRPSKYSLTTCMKVVSQAPLNRGGHMVPYHVRGDDVIGRLGCKNINLYTRRLRTDLIIFFHSMSSESWTSTLLLHSSEKKICFYFLQSGTWTIVHHSEGPATSMKDCWK